MVVNGLGVVVPFVIALKMLFVGGTMAISPRLPWPTIVIWPVFAASIRRATLVIVPLVEWPISIGAIARWAALISILVKRRL
jgi:hypothetical protein